jgi:hypothetical protein
MAPAPSRRPLLAALDVEHPEWRPLLAVIELALREAERAEWERFVPALAHSGLAGRPLLGGAILNVAPRLSRLLRRTRRSRLIRWC